MTKRALASVALAAGLAAALPAAAKAATIAPTLNCPVPTVLQPYERFGDSRWYELAPGGSFEIGASTWTLAGGATLVAGNEPWFLNSRTDTSALSLPPGAVATSAAMCVDISYPTFRFPVRSLDPNGQTDLDIEVRYPDADDSAWMKVRTESGKLHEGWRITEDVDLKPDHYSGEAGQRLVYIRLSARGKKDDPGWRVDDVYVDPRLRG